MLVWGKGTPQPSELVTSIFMVLDSSDSYGIGRASRRPYNAVCNSRSMEYTTAIIVVVRGIVIVTVQEIGL